jgi:Domain of unknown function (DUF4336)
MKAYEPLGVAKPVDRDLWILDGPVVRMPTPWGEVPFPTRAVLVRLASGGLWVWSPIALSDATRAAVDAIGPVEHLVSPNKIHYVGLAAWKAAYPTAVAWASPGVRERAASRNVAVTFDRDLVATPDPAWEAEIDQLVFEGSRLMEEVVFLHRPTRTLIVADLIENFEPERLTFPERLLMKIGGVADPDGKASTAYRMTFFGRHDVARASAARILAWKPERILIAHGRCYDGDASAELTRAFRWLDVAPG